MQTIVRQFNAGVGFNVGIEIPVAAWLSLVPELEANYNFIQGETLTDSKEYYFTAEPHANIVYTVVWSEVWESGTAEVVSGGQIIVVPFRVKTGLEFSTFTNSLGCDQ